MTKSAEERVLNAVAGRYGLSLTSERLDLDTWGHTDGALSLGTRVHLVVEVETSQKHPCTNVLKLWPYLEDHPEHRLVLVHVFEAEAANDKSSRGRLGVWVAGKIQAAMPDRFRYCRLAIDADDELSETQGSLTEAIDALTR